MSYWWIQENYPHWDEEEGRPYQEEQQDVFPRPDQVLRYYRMFGPKAMKQEDLALQLRIARSEISEMEKGSRQINIQRRRALSRILSIPPKLFGIILLDGSQTPKPSVDIEEHQEKLQQSWEMEFRTSAHTILPDLLGNIYTLNLALDYASDKTPLQDLLCDYHALVARVLVDQQSPDEALMHQDKAVNYAISQGDITRIALNLHRKGCLLGDMNLEELACVAYNQAMQYERRLPPNVRYAVISNAAMHYAKNRSVPDYQIIGLNAQAGNILRNNPVSDNDHKTDYSLDRYGVTTAATMYYLGRNQAAREALEIHDEAHIRRSGYACIIESWAYKKERKYGPAIASAEAGLEAVQKVHSMINIARVQKIYDDLSDGPCKDSNVVARLGQMLGTVGA